MSNETATVEDSYRRFVETLVETKVVYCLANDEGVANAESHEDESTIVLMFWSDPAELDQLCIVFDGAFEASEIPLFDFLYGWLAGMSEDGVLAGPNWSRELIGREMDPSELRLEIESHMPDGLLDNYERRYKKQVDGEN